jgi:hypothetical protein
LTTTESVGITTPAGAKAIAEPRMSTATAAIVWAWTEEGINQHNLPEQKYSGRLSISDFAALKIRGLSTRNSVRKYRQRWQEAHSLGRQEVIGSVSSAQPSANVRSHKLALAMNGRP